MRDFTEIINLGNTFDIKINGNTAYGKIYDRKGTINFIAGRNEGGWEHVSVSVGNGRNAPTWEVMCKVKKIFWKDEEDVIQYHAKESEYFHGFDNVRMEVFHLWRPANGDWELLNNRMQK